MTGSNQAINQAFSLKGVTKRLGDFSLCIDDLALDRGYVMGLVGRNGAGKSTTIKILLNLIYPDSGDIRVLGLRQPEADMEIKRRVGYVSENPAFYADMTVEWMARLMAKCYPTWDAGLYEGYLRKFGLERRKKVKELSKGTVVKLGLTLALSHKPELLVLDEPTSGIDPVIRHELLAEIAGIIRDERRTVILSSHITQDIEQVADYVGIIDQGSVVEFDDKESLLDRWKKVSGTIADDRADGGQGANGGALQTAGDGLDSGKSAALSRLLEGFKRDGASFQGVTRHFSDDTLSRIQAAGASNLRVSGVDLDEILVCIAGKEM